MSLELNLHVHQRSVLLRTVNVRFAERTAGDGTADGCFHCLGGVEVNEVKNLAFGYAIGGAEVLLVDGLCSLYLSVSLEVLENHVEREFVRTGVLASDNGCDIY